ncbi:pre-B lymphocyte protein 3-like [Falco naumanni]|uniref:pre-B lymphocyte protein 3-like n=1 Tax=Falco naumanni TaxID=148594 RepID=UPI001ADE88BE|nr:pre-B lymphocyte protein 3-like [Falco naumanni]
MALGFMVLLLVELAGTVTASLVHAASRAQPVLTQPSSVLVLPGQTARLSCILSPQYNISEFGISWYQQRPGHSLRYLLYYNSERDKHKPAKIPDRFSATKDLASNACILIIASAHYEDNGNYYCALSHAFNWF